MMKAMMGQKKSTHNEHQNQIPSSYHPTSHTGIGSPSPFRHHSAFKAAYNYQTQISHIRLFIILLIFHLNMTRLQLIFPLLLICLVLVAFQQQYASTSSLQETKSVSFKMSAAVYSSRKMGANIQKVWRNTKEATEKKVRKTPSGPSPVGNTRPPSKA